MLIDCSLTIVTKNKFFAIDNSLEDFQTIMFVFKNFHLLNVYYSTNYVISIVILSDEKPTFKI